MNPTQNDSSLQENAQQLDDWEILDEISSIRSMSPILVPTPPPPPAPPAPYSHLPAWLYTQICNPQQKQRERTFEGENDKAVLVGRPLNKVRELQELQLGTGFEDITLAEQKKQGQESLEQMTDRILHSSASLGRLLNSSVSKGGNNSADTFMMLASDLKVSKSLSDLKEPAMAKDLIKVSDDQENYAPKSNMTILLMGDSVESWAAVGNKIIGLNVFASSSHNNQQSLRLQRASVTRNNTRITLVTIPVLKPLQPLPPSLKTQLTSLLQTGVDAILIAGMWYGSLAASVDKLLRHVRNVAGDEAADHVLMLLRRPVMERGNGSEAGEERRMGGQGEPDVEQIVQQAATRTLAVKSWESMNEKQIDKVVDMAYKLSINQGKLKISAPDSIPLRKWPDQAPPKQFDYVMVQKGAVGERCSVSQPEVGICKFVSNVSGWFNRFSKRFNCAMRWAIIAGFGATLASIFAAPLFGFGGGMVKPFLEIYNVSNSPVLGYETSHSQKTRLELQTIYH